MSNRGRKYRVILPAEDDGDWHWVSIGEACDRLLARLEKHHGDKQNAALLPTDGALPSDEQSPRPRGHVVMKDNNLSAAKDQDQDSPELPLRAALPARYDSGPGSVRDPSHDRERTELDRAPAGSVMKRYTIVVTEHGGLEYELCTVDANPRDIVKAARLKKARLHERGQTGQRSYLYIGVRDKKTHKVVCD
jgi:hypothetical protein